MRGAGGWSEFTLENGRENSSSAEHPDHLHSVQARSASSPLAILNMRALVALAVIALIAFAAATVVEDPEIEIWSFDRFTEYVSSLPEDQRHRNPNITNPNVAPHASFASWSRCGSFVCALRFAPISALHYIPSPLLRFSAFYDTKYLGVFFLCVPFFPWNAPPLCSGATDDHCWQALDLIFR